jgi:hypothetical protein
MQINTRKILRDLPGRKWRQAGTRSAGNEFGYIIEGNKGKLSFKGTRFVGFERV